ncbi:hypothetical protein Tco_1489626, partial [Tanacetum coccineum]
MSLSSPRPTPPPSSPFPPRHQPPRLPPQSAPSKPIKGRLDLGFRQKEGVWLAAKQPKGVRLVYHHKGCVGFVLNTEMELVVLLGLYTQRDVEYSLFETHFIRLMMNDEGFNHEAYWNRIRKPTTGKKKSIEI